MQWERYLIIIQLLRLFICHLKLLLLVTKLLLQTLQLNFKLIQLVHQRLHTGKTPFEELDLLR